MTKAYWVATYREILDPAKMSAYAALAGPAITAAGERYWCEACQVRFTTMG